MKKQNKNIHFIVSILLLGLSSCNGQKNDTANNLSDIIIGKWTLTVKQVNYPTILFNKDSTAIFTSMGDTIYRFKYYLSKNELVLKDFNHKKTRDKILKLDSDSLIFETLADEKRVQKYVRK